MAAGGGVDAVDDLRGNVHSSVEAKGHIGAKDVVVDGLGQADDVEPFLREQVGRFVGAIAAQAKQAVQLGVLVGLFHGGHFIDVVILHHAHHFKRRALGAQDGAAQGQNAAEIVLGHLLVVPVDQAAVAVQDADDLHVVTHAGVQCFCYTADGGVQARTVAAGGQDTNTFFHSKALFPLSFRAADPEHTIYSIRVFRMRVGVKPSGQNFTCCRAAKAPGKKVCGKSKKVVDKDTLFGYNIPCQQRRAAPDKPNNGDLHSGSAVDSDSTCGSSILSSPTRKPQSPSGCGIFGA